VSDDRDMELIVEQWLEEGARPMPTPILEASLEAIPRVARRRRGPAWGASWRGSSALPRALGVVAAAAVIVVAAVAGPGLLRSLVPSQGVVGSAPVSAPSCAPPPAGLTAWWPGDGSGRDAVSGLEARLSGGAAYGSGLVGQAFSLDGSSSFVAVPDAPSLDVGRGDFSVDLWARFKETNLEQILMEKWVQRYNQRSSGWTLTKLATNVIGFFTESSEGAAGTQSERVDLPADTWFHVAARRQGNVFDIFLNGRIIASSPASGAPLNLDTEASLKFGHRGNPDDTPGSQDVAGFFLNGQVDEVDFLAGRALSDDEVLRIYRAGSAGKCGP
jgi:hypothetical protein